jgi:adenine-specific DNA-methyltransferase
MTKEEKFYRALEDIFVGAKIEGQGGFVNLMRIKSNYYSKIEDILKKDIEAALKNHPRFREELFDKLYSFFNRYFTESGSIYFNSTPFHNNIYEKVYTDEKDVILFWKTQMLYYVKTDRIFRSLPVEFDGFKFYFDASKIESKKANEKRSLIFELKEIKDDRTIVFSVLYSEKGTKTKQDEILKAIKRKGIATTEEQLERAFRVFEKQSEVDFFINKNAKAFLQEQFKLWSYQYFWEGAKEWGADRVNELQILKDIAFKIIDFISQFEDELVQIWNKPKFVQNSNYVITLDRIKDISLVEKILKHKNINEQIKEWQELGIVDENFKVSDIFTTDLTGKHLSEKYQHLPIDTKYFKDLELEILSQFEDLDNSLDGWLIKSENYQALNTILPKFKEKVQTIFIDPPFNKAESDQFAYIANYLDSSWISLLENRLILAKYILNKTGTIFVNSDDKCNSYTRFLLDQIFQNFQNEIIWAYEKPGAGLGKFKNNHANIYFYSKNEEFLFNTLYVPRKGEKELTKREGRHDVEYEGKISPDWWVDMWDDIPSFATMMTAGERAVKMLGIQFPTQIPEKLLYRVIHTGSNKDNLVVDFFAGTGVTAAVAHKMGRKWINIELGEQFNTIVLPRMKKVLAYDKSGISKEVKEYQGGGFFKYYELEQYEETLANCKYEDGDLFNSPSKTPYQEYVFLKDEKMLKTLEIDYEKEKVKVDLSKLYPDPSAPLGTSIDIAETLSNLTGKWIKKISENEVEFEDGIKVDIKNLDYKLIKPLIWWE